MKILFRILLLFVLLFGGPFLSQGQMDNYCQLPSSISNPIAPNVMFLIDSSGSMTWCAYTGSSCNTGAYPYAATTTYEGYFDPTKYYTLSSGVYVETTPTGLPCVQTCTNWACRNSPFGGGCDNIKGTHGCSNKRYACCTAYSQSGDCGIETGNYLNYLHMTRVDVLRWALTGGRPVSCDNETDTKCNVETYFDPPHQLSCDSGGCILEAYDGTQVKARWDRLNGDNGGLLFQLKTDLDTKPYIGAMFFANSGITKTVYIGDFTGSNNIDTANPFKNVITSVNYQSAGGATPTGPAMWDAYNYFAQNSPQYGGPTPQSGSGSDWKNPMNRCFDTNNDGACQGGEFQFVPCSKNFVILMTDGQWNRGGKPVPNYYVCKIDDDVIAESPDPVVPAYYMHKTGFTNVASTPPTTSYVESVYTVGMWLGGTGEQSLKNVAMYGAFNRSNTWPGGTSGYPQGTSNFVDDCCSGANCGKGSSTTALPASSSDWDSNNDGLPDTFFKASSASGIKDELAKIILEIMRRVSSGSAVSILSSSEGTGANLLQAVYYPRKAFGAVEIEWTGEMQNLWYYVDPYLESSTIREDTNYNNDTTNANILTLTKDYVLALYFDPLDGKTKAKRYSTDNTGGSKTYIDTVQLDDIKNLWEIGTTLFERTSARTVYTTTDESTLLGFSAASKTTLRSYLQAADDTESEKIINYINGADQTGYRNRTVTVTTSSLGNTPGVWRLGDIVNSSPRMQSSNPLNSYHKSVPDGYSDTTYSAYIHATGTNSYSERGMSYIGANDGMLHAFKHGQLEQTWTGQGANDKAKLVNPDATTPLGSEVWAFIPKNSLPYLKYLADPDYCHLFYVDGSSLIIDASIENITGTDPDDYANDTKTLASWKTVMISGMGLGGASKITSSSCTTGGTGTCVKTPITDPVDGTKGLGYSSYFALDVTIPNTPSLLWEFSNPNLGFSTTGPGIVRIGDASKNGKWFAVFASGPTGPIETDERQFLAKSDQTLKIFILDLKTGDLLRTIDTGIAEAFGGSLYNATIDTDKGDVTATGRYSDDAIYLGYTKKDTTALTWTKGGVIRILTKESANPADWAWSYVIDNIGPVTSAVTKLQDRKNKNLWLYFGSGRFFYRLGTGVDDPSNTRVIYGVREPCYNNTVALPPGPVNDIDNNCTTSVTTGLTDQSTTILSTLPTGSKGWYINLATPVGNNGAERVITDPFAVSSGAVFFTTYTPSTDVCAEGGNTAIWAVDYDTGGVVYLSGMALTQVSTGAIHELPLDTVFVERGNRRTALMTGMPPKGQGLSILVGPKAIRRILHIKEK